MALMFVAANLTVLDPATWRSMSSYAFGGTRAHQGLSRLDVCRRDSCGCASLV